MQFHGANITKTQAINMNSQKVYDHICATLRWTYGI